MGTVVLWALLTGTVSGGVWAAIVLLGRQRRLAERQDAIRLTLERRLDELEGVEARLAELEERVDFAERILPSHDAAPRRLPSSPDAG